MRTAGLAPPAAGPCGPPEGRGTLPASASGKLGMTAGAEEHDGSGGLASRVPVHRRVGLIRQRGRVGPRPGPAKSHRQAMLHSFRRVTLEGLTVSRKAMFFFLIASVLLVMVCVHLVNLDLMVLVIWKCFVFMSFIHSFLLLVPEAVAHMQSTRWAGNKSTVSQPV